MRCEPPRCGHVSRRGDGVEASQSVMTTAVKHPSTSGSRGKKKPVITTTFPRVVTLLSSKSMERVEQFDSPHHHVVLNDYSAGLSPPAPPLRCSFCAFTYPSRGVKWEQMDHFLDSDWARANLARYDWLWYPDDDIVFGPGQLDQFLQAGSAPARRFLSSLRMQHLPSIMRSINN